LGTGSLVLSSGQNSIKASVTAGFHMQHLSLTHE
jgi:hypothetical protein